jgi:hypothetical protein
MSPMLQSNLLGVVPYKQIISLVWLQVTSDRMWLAGRQWDHVNVAYDRAQWKILWKTVKKLQVS